MTLVDGLRLFFVLTGNASLPESAWGCSFFGQDLAPDLVLDPAMGYLTVKTKFVECVVAIMPLLDCAVTSRV